MQHKTYTEIQPGDIFRTEYGDYGNYVSIVFHHNELENRWLKTVGHYKDSNSEFVGYSPIYNGQIPTYEVIGHVEERNKDE